MDAIHNADSSFSQMNGSVKQDRHKIGDFSQRTLSGLLSCEEGEVLKQYGFDSSTPNTSSLSLSKAASVTQTKKRKRSQRLCEPRDSIQKDNVCCCKLATSSSQNEDDIPLYIRFLNNTSCTTQKMCSNFEGKAQEAERASRKRGRALEVLAMSKVDSWKLLKKKKKKSSSSERQDLIQDSSLTRSESCALPYDMSCLFIEVRDNDYLDNARAAVLRRLLARWSGGMEMESLGEDEKEVSKERRAGTPPRIASPPPIHRRLIVLMARTTDVLKKTLLWWTLRPYPEHALILPIFGISPNGEAQKLSTYLCTSDHLSKEKRSPDGAGGAAPENLDKAEANCNGARPTRQSSRRRLFCESLTLLQRAALEHLCHSFAINTSRSYALCYTKPYWDALRAVGVPASHMKRTLEKCTQHITEVFSNKRKALLSNNQAPPVNLGVGSWLESSIAACQYKSDGSSADEQRELIFSSLCSWNGLARTLVKNARRPELIFRVFTTLSSTVASRALPVPICYALVRPVSMQGLCFGCAASRDVRFFAYQSPPVVLSTDAEELFRRNFFKFLSAFFTPPVFRTAVDVIRSSSADYISEYACSTLGYLQFEVSSWLRQYVHVSLVVDLRPIIAQNASNKCVNSTLEASVLRALQCSCSPRRHEKILFCEDGNKKCRHQAELLFFFVNRQITRQTQVSLKAMEATETNILVDQQALS